MAKYTDAELATAVARSRSWRGVLGQLGLPPQSAGAARAARARAVDLGLDTAHFTGQRRWSDRELTDAVAASRSWSEVMDRLGLAAASGSARTLLSAHAARLGIAFEHLAQPAPAPTGTPFDGRLELRHLDRAGPLIAASWFTLRGYDVAWPLEPARYDLVVTAGSRPYRVQVKTTRSRSGNSWAVRLASNRPRGAAVYSPDEIDYFFILDGDLTCYLIPVEVVGGYQLIHLRRYAAFAVGRHEIRAA